MTRYLPILLLLLSCEKSEVTTITDFSGCGESVSIPIGKAKSVVLNGSIQCDSFLMIGPLADDGELYCVQTFEAGVNDFRMQFETGLGWYYDLPTYSNNQTITIQGSQPFSIKGTKSIRR